MESKVDALEQQNQDLKGEVGQLREQMAQMFQILIQTNAAVTTLVNTNAAGSGASPNPKEDSRAQHQTSGNPPPFMVHRQAS
ncbi:hypothetical protein CR513_15802, partial [Mucuna pruriens]